MILCFAHSFCWESLNYIVRCPETVQFFCWVDRKGKVEKVTSLHSPLRGMQAKLCVLLIIANDQNPWRARSHKWSNTLNFRPMFLAPTKATHSLRSTQMGLEGIHLKTINPCCVRHCLEQVTEYVCLSFLFFKTSVHYRICLWRLMKN
jgi:hypothetical protein